MWLSDAQLDSILVDRLIGNDSLCPFCGSVLQSESNEHGIVVGCSVCNKSQLRMQKHVTIKP